ncbi:cytosine permease, partial [Yersinia enterocolitica]|nr:cytosine permease [Yersinia enterocolitica]
VTEWGIPTINSLLAASLIYWLFKVAVNRNQKLVGSEKAI